MFAVYLSSMILHIEYLLTQPFLASLQSDVFSIYSHCILGKLNYIREVDHNDSFIFSQNWFWVASGIYYTTQRYMMECQIKIMYDELRT